MKEKTIYGIWGSLYILCAGLGFIPHPEGLGKALMVLASWAFFVPGAVLLYRGSRDHSRNTVRRVRNLAAASLGLTLAALIGNFLSAGLSRTAGNVLHAILAVVSAPMLCGQYWVVSLFFWACLLMTGISLSRKKA